MLTCDVCRIKPFGRLFPSPSALSQLGRGPRTLLPDVPHGRPFHITFFHKLCCDGMNHIVHGPAAGQSDDRSRDAAAKFWARQARKVSGLMRSSGLVLLANSQSKLFRPKTCSLSLQGYVRPTSRQVGLSSVLRPVSICSLKHRALTTL